MNQRAFNYYSGKRWRSGIRVEACTRKWAWESYHSELNQVGGVEFPAPALADFLGLRFLAGSLDLRDTVGGVATLYRIAPGPSYSSHFLYMRRDLLESYLITHRLKIVRAVWGERTMEYDFFDRELTDEQRDPFVRQVNKFRFADCDGQWMAVLGKEPV